MTHQRVKEQQQRRGSEPRESSKTFMRVAGLTATLHHGMACITSLRTLLKISTSQINRIIARPSGRAEEEERGGRMSKINLGLMLEEWEIIIKALEIYSSVAYEFQQEYNAQWAHELCRELHNKLWEVEEYRKKFGNSPFDDVEGKPIEIDEEDMPF